MRSCKHPFPSKKHPKRLFWLLLTCAWLLPAPCALSQQADFRTYVIQEIGLSFGLPHSWKNLNTTTVTWKEFIEEYRKTQYNGPNGNELWHAVGSFSGVDVDSALVPSDSAYTAHKMRIIIERAPTLYKKWLCLHHRYSFWSRKHLMREDAQVVHREKLHASSLPAALPNAFGLSFAYSTEMENTLTQGMLITFVHEERCYEIKMETTSVYRDRSIQLHRRILDSFKLKG